ncbi:hypothetical protein DFS34DRAFT_668621 [Phlyctochytrium arcticum]|nr:hypothetical protein DFS34DRAFT_668621 [Phlyctochytrium arcticum]
MGEDQEMEEHIGKFGQQSDPSLNQDDQDDEDNEIFPTEQPDLPEKYAILSQPSPPLSEIQEANFDFLLFETATHMSEAAHRALVATRYGSTLLQLGVPKDVRLFKRAAWRYLDRFLHIDDIAPKIPNFPGSIPYLDSPRAIYLWLQEPILSQVCVEINKKHTEPFMEFIYEHRSDLQMPNNFPLNGPFPGMWTGSQWLEPYRRTADIWYPVYKKCQQDGMPVLFLHELLYEDGFPVFRYRFNEHFVWTATLGEFSHGHRGSTNSPAILPKTLYNAK